MVRRPVSVVAGLVGVLLILALTSLMTSTALAEELSFGVRLSRDNVTVQETDGVSSVLVTDKNYDLVSDEAQPELPYRVVNVLLPQGSAVSSYRFEYDNPTVLKRNAVMLKAPAMLSEDGKPGRGDALAAAAETGDVYPASAGKYLGTGYLHGRAIASFAVFPMRIDSGTLTLAENVQLIIETKPASSTGAVVVRERYREGFDRTVGAALSRFVINPEMNDRYSFNQVHVAKPKGGFQPTAYPSLEGSPVDYLIITTDALASTYQRLADFKTAKGVPTVVRTVEWIVANTKNGADVPETLRNFIRDAYSKWGITYLLLGGDTDVMPPRYGYSSFYLGGVQMPVDLYFSCLDGSWNDNHNNLWGEAFLSVPKDNPDLYAEVYQGRLPGSTPATANILIDKIIDYENAPHRDYMDRYMFLGEVLQPTDWPANPTISLNGANFCEFVVQTAMVGSPMQLVRMYETDYLFSGAVHESRVAALDSMNVGFNHINQVGHGFRFNMSVGDASILNADADALTNTGKWFNLYMLNCTAAAFDFFCLGEHFLLNPNGGAVSVIGANQSAFPNASANYMNEYNNLIFKKDVVHIGEAFARSRLPRTPVAATGDNVDLWTHYIYSLLADPEMPLFSGPVDTFTVVHTASVPLGPSGILFNVTAGGFPVDSAVVCLSKNGDDYQVVPTNSLGVAIVNFTAESPGSISVVVTGLNHARHQSYITVNPSASAYVDFSSLTVDDDQTGGTFGNSDGVVDAGETIDFTLELANTGGSAANGVWCALRSSNPSVTVLDSIATFGTVSAGGTKTALDPVRVAFDAGLSDEASVYFTLEIHDGSSGLWNDHFVKLVHTPILELVLLRKDDSNPPGNGDGIIEPGEEFRLYYQVKNYGTGTASGLSASLQDLSGQFVLYTSTDSYVDLAPMTGAENTNGFDISETDTIPLNRLEVTITDLFGHTMVDTVELRSPAPPSTLTFDSSLGPDRLEISWDLSPSADAVHYNVYRATTSGGPYTKANVDPLDHGVFLDTSLLPSTQYFFKATAIDSSGNESGKSAEISASTNPPQLPGFPIQMAITTPSTPAVGDLDGDGVNEIVVGNEYIYAWHSDGLELRDGDSDPQSWGPINTVGNEFAAPVALANLDDSPGLEIVAADLYGKSVYVMDHNGNVLPGWPQVCENGFRAGPVLGDLDGDGTPEIIAIDEYGVIYAWHKNGTEYRDGDNNPSTTGVFFRTPATVTHSMMPALCDIDGDGKDEIIQGTRSGNIYALNDDGTAVPGWPVTMGNETVGSIVTGDVDDDGQPEILVHSRSSELFLLKANGTMAPGWPRYVAISQPFFVPSPALADFDGDGKLEVVVIGNTALGTKVYVIKSNGTDWPGWPFIFTYSTTECSPVVADISGDGVPDIIEGDDSRFIYAWNINGQMLPGFPIATMDAVRATPFVTDLDKDGDVDLIVHSWDKNMYVYDLTAPWDKSKAQWPTLQGNVHRNGRYNFAVPTAIGQVAFTYVVHRDAVNLTWVVPSGAGLAYDVERSLVADGHEGAFSRLTSGVSADIQGTIQFTDRGAEMGRTYVYKLLSKNDPKDTFTTGPIYVPVSRAGLLQNSPNPFNPTTQITYFVPEGGGQHVSLVVYDVTGARVRTLVNGTKPAGRFVATWDGRDDRGNPVGSGVYFYRLEQRGFSGTKKMVFLK